MTCRRFPRTVCIGFEGEPDMLEQIGRMSRPHSNIASDPQIPRTLDPRAVIQSVSSYRRLHRGARRRGTDYVTRQPPPDQETEIKVRRFMTSDDRSLSYQGAKTRLRFNQSTADNRVRVGLKD